MKPHVRALVLSAGKRGVPVSEIARVLGVSPRTVKRAKAPIKKRTPCKAVQMRRQLVRRIAQKKIKVGHFSFQAHNTSRSISAELYKRHGVRARRRTIIRDLHTVGAKCRVRPRCTTRRAGDYALRLQFARKWVKVRNIGKKLLFSDECWITSGERTGRFQWVFGDEAPFPRESRSKWNVASLQVWCCIGYNYKGPIVIFPTTMWSECGAKMGFRLNRYAYIRRCLSKVVKDIAHTQRIFLQDGARAHDNAHVEGYLQRKSVKFVDDYPPYSADLNCCENFWSLLKDRVGALVPTDLEDLRDKIKRAYEEISLADINKLCARYEVRLKNLIQSKGQSTKKH